MDITRRGFLGSFAALAATAVVPVSLAPIEDTERLVRAMQSGIIRNKTFLFDGHVTLSSPRPLLIENCRFIWNNAEQIPITMTLDGNGILIKNSHFEIRNAGKFVIGPIEPLPAVW